MFVNTHAHHKHTHTHIAERDARALKALRESLEEEHAKATDKLEMEMKTVRTTLDIAKSEADKLTKEKVGKVCCATFLLPFI